MNFIDFDYVSVQELRPGMMINYTPVKGSDSENYLVLDVKNEVFGTFETKVHVLNPDGEKEVLTFNDIHSCHPPNIRVYPEFDD